MKQIKLDNNENQGIRYQWAADDSQQCYRRISGKESQAGERGTKTVFHL